MTDAERVDLAKLRLLMVIGSPCERNVALDTMVLYAETLAVEVVRLREALKYVALRMTHTNAIPSHIAQDVRRVALAAIAANPQAAPETT